MSGPAGPGASGAGPPPAPDMSNVDPGLQPVLIAMLYLFPGLALTVLMVRFWRKSVDHLLGGGMLCRSLTHSMVTLTPVQTTLSLLLHGYWPRPIVSLRICVRYLRLCHRGKLTGCIVVKQMYTGYRQEDVPFYAIDMISAFKASTSATPHHFTSTNCITATIRTQYRVQPVYLSRQSVVLVESVQAPFAQPLDQAHNHRPPDSEWRLHGRHNHRLCGAMSTRS